jgi:KEOPS complex subunit Cgi121
MVSPDPGFAIRSAVITVRNRDTTLQVLQGIGERHGMHVICFDAEKMAGVRHAEAAIRHAYRSFYSGDPVSNSFEMEALLYAAGTRQCGIAVSFGIHEGENHLYVCCCPEREEAWQELELLMQVTRAPEDGVPAERLPVLAAIFDITPEELDAAGRNRVVDLVIERIALLDVSK